jgi:hypothetical protein
MKKTKGWKSESERHALARKGIKTKAKGIKYEDNYNGKDYYKWTCDSCGRSRLIQEGEDVAYCPCEFESEGKTRESKDGRIIHSFIKYEDELLIDDALTLWNTQRNDYRNDAEHFLSDWEDNNPKHKRLSIYILERITERGDN